MLAGVKLSRMAIMMDIMIEEYKKTDLPDLRDLTLEGLKDFAGNKGVKPYRATQAYAWLFSRGVADIDEMTDLSIEFRELLKESFLLYTPVIDAKEVAPDGTTKFTLRLSDGSLVESVIIPEGERVTLCVSTQCGCLLACAFCMTGKGGAGRNLTLSEMASQVIAANTILPGDSGVTNLVLMGMGEPFLNYDEVLKFTEILIDPKGFGLSPRRVTLSTAGIVPAIRKFGTASKVSLAVSLNAATDALRDRLMPINKKYPLSELIGALREYPLSKGRYITIEYVLLKGVNDSHEDARRLAKLLKPVKCKINIIPFNPHPGSGFERPGEEAVAAFMDILYNNGYVVIMRQSKGSEISAACGQLKGRAANG